MISLDKNDLKLDGYWISCLVPWPRKTSCLFSETKSRNFASYAMNYDIILSLSLFFVLEIAVK